MSDSRLNSYPRVTCLSGPLHGGQAAERDQQTWPSLDAQPPTATRVKLGKSHLSNEDFDKIERDPGLWGLATPEKAPLLEIVRRYNKLRNSKMELKKTAAQNIRVNLEPVLDRPPSVATVQTLSLMGIYQGLVADENSIENTWSLMGLSCKLAQSVRRGCSSPTRCR